MAARWRRSRSATSWQTSAVRTRFETSTGSVLFLQHRQHAQGASFFKKAHGCKRELGARGVQAGVALKAAPGAYIVLARLSQQHTPKKP